MERTITQHRTAVLKVGGIAPLGAILRSNGAKKTTRTIGGQNNTKGVEMLNH